MDHALRLGALGAGNMAAAIVRGLLAAGTLRPEQLAISDVDATRVAELVARHGVRAASDNRELVRTADVVVLAVKPQIVPRVLAEIGGELGPTKLLISIAAGVTTQTLVAGTASGTRLIRVMPNTPAMALAGATAIARGPEATQEDLELAVRMFDAVGRSVVLDEGALDAVTGLSGSGPAYVLTFIEALADGGVKNGLSRAQALLLATQTVLGTARMLLETGDHPAVLRDLVTSPGGTTIAGLMELERGTLRHTVMSAVDAATRRSRELGR